MRNRIQTERRLLSAAIQQFSKHGLHGASVRAIAKEADVNLSLISQYFGGKEQLYFKCIEAIYEKLLTALSELNGSLSRDPSEAIRQVVLRAVDMGQSDRAALLLTTRHLIEHGQLDPNKRETILKPVMHGLTEQLEGHSYLPKIDLEFAVFSAITLLGRIVTLGTEDLNSILSFARSKREFIEKTSNQIFRLLGLNDSQFTAAKFSGDFQR